MSFQVFDRSSTIGQNRISFVHIFNNKILYVRLLLTYLLVLNLPLLLIAKLRTYLIVTLVLIGLISLLVVRPLLVAIIIIYIIYLFQLIRFIFFIICISSSFCIIYKSWILFINKIDWNLYILITLLIWCYNVNLLIQQIYLSRKCIKGLQFKYS